MSFSPDQPAQQPALRFYPTDGLVAPSAWAALARAARDFADAHIHLEHERAAALHNLRDSAAAHAALEEALFPDARSEDAGSTPGRLVLHSSTPTAQPPTGTNPAGPAAEAMPIGWLADRTTAGRVDLGAGLHRGLLPAEYAELIAHLEVPISITPWRGLIFHDLAEGDAEVVLRVLAPRGFIFDINSPLLAD
ncbi:hypothetical protein [Corynebacterium sp.]|uniref:hypothetical protein n=1 Tax=Corynebacterium sp. TaxID=1720 RepID=UPI0026DBA803|nr:hypothetical protein [Corynebacterium sp.]MDO5031601.1 hypothetical protein [Corynebacterium sp.]